MPNTLTFVLFLPPRNCFFLYFYGMKSRNGNTRKGYWFSLLYILTGWFLSLYSLQAQIPADKSPLQNEKQDGNQYFPGSAPHGILFQMEQDENTAIFLLQPQTGTRIALTPFAEKARHPVWVPGKNAIVFDAGSGHQSRLFFWSLKTGKKKRLIPRKIPSREASFTPSRHLVVFSGFDDRTQHWQIFSYDFVYDNLNRLTNEQGNCSFPVFSPNGKHIIYTVKHDNGISWLKIMNWYGEEQKLLYKGVRGKACWTPDNWRILFTVFGNSGYGLYSVRQDGSGILKIARFSAAACCPVVLQNGEIWLSVKRGSRFSIRQVRR